jgi:glyoxylase-like metal-dependent hydrolase (beta-lactamase superfamily II)
MLTTILSGLHRITLPTPFAIGDVNAYLVESAPLTLIDCGVRTPETLQVLTESLAQIGYAVRDIQRLFITHHHVDHVGLAEDIVRESGAAVWTHPFNCAWLERPDETRAISAAFMEQFFHENGVPDEALRTLAKSNRYLAKLTGTTKVDVTVSEGDSIDLLGQQWQVYHTPGHAGGLVCLYQPETRMMLSSDQLLRDVSSNALLEPPLPPNVDRPRRLLDYIREIERMAALEIEVAHTGHGEPIYDVRSRVAARLEFYQQRMDKLYGLFERQPQHLYTLTQRLFPKAIEAEPFLTLSETLGHLDLLERDDRIGQEKRGDFVYWIPRDA